MNLSGRFFVKSNYIRAAKENWVLCDVRLLTDEVDTFLCIKSVVSSNSENKHEGTSNEASKDISSEKSKQSNFTALCNLSEYKSCSMRTVNVNERDYFAIRLVPSGVIGNKHLLIAMIDENEVTTWMAVCKACLGKKSKGSHRDNLSTIGTLSKAGSFASLKPVNSSNDAEFDEGVLDNEVYEAYSSEDKIPALLEEAGDWIKLHLGQPECYLRLTEERLEVLDAITQRPVHWFPYLLIRRFGAANGILRVDAGRRCSMGDGRFFFRCSSPNGQPVDALVTQIRQLALEAKQRVKRNQLASSNIELNDHGGSRNTLTQNPDGNLSGRMHSSTDFETDDSAPGTLPRAKAKRFKAPLPLPNGVQIKSTTNDSPSPSGFTTDSPDGQAVQQINSPLTSPTAGEGDLVKATPGRALKPQEESVLNSNVYDNVPRPPRKGSRLAGGVNVLPLPARAHSKDHSSTSRERSSDTDKVTSVTSLSSGLGNQDVSQIDSTPLPCLVNKPSASPIQNEETSPEVLKEGTPSNDTTVTSEDSCPRESGRSPSATGTNGLNENPPLPFRSAGHSPRPDHSGIEELGRRAHFKHPLPPPLPNSGANKNDEVIKTPPEASPKPLLRPSTYAAPSRNSTKSPISGFFLRAN
ncbi:unnamed protein product [Calicophoron daubneyi]|uniref:IRS-type PTB domain-containing protein n=1 Tax=Calicophoron daubneyi TaxID=300641 RepID=A0AAV2TT68_CALDB